MNWQRYKDYSLNIDSLGFMLDFSRVSFEENFFKSMQTKMQNAFDKMQELECGSIANPDEQRMVGHYWLRNPDIAPSQEIAQEIKSTLAKIADFVEKIHSGKILSSNGKVFKNLLCIGIGGSALGPELVAEALGNPQKDKMKVFFLDNTDPDGFDVVFSKLGSSLDETLVLIASKSGGTPEPRNAMLETISKFESFKIDYSKHFVVTTGKNSQLYNFAKEKGFLDIFPMWDWVGGRTSEFAAVGILPAALQGIDTNAMLEGAKIMDIATRENSMRKNPAAMLALAWYYCTDGSGKKDMVILPYKDRLLLCSRYLQQLIMESLGKELDLDGKVVSQGLSVYGNKGSTDQHAFVQQLRDGIDNFFVTFIEVLKDRDSAEFFVEKNITSGDYLQGFFLGTRQALSQKKRENITISLLDACEKSVGALIALFERATGLYASLINVNAYHQPGVEAGKKAANDILKIKSQIVEFLDQNQGSFTAEEIAQKLNLENDSELVFKLLIHLTANHRAQSNRVDDSCFNNTFTKKI